jgi:hypothetical protein
VSIDGLDHLQRWLGAVGGRPAVLRGKNIPEEPKLEGGSKEFSQRAQSMLV